MARVLSRKRDEVRSYRPCQHRRRKRGGWGGYSPPRFQSGGAKVSFSPPRFQLLFNVFFLQTVKNILKYLKFLKFSRASGANHSETSLLTAVPRIFLAKIHNLWLVLKVLHALKWNRRLYSVWMCLSLIPSVCSSRFFEHLHVSPSTLSRRQNWSLLTYFIPKLMF